MAFINKVVNADIKEWVNFFSLNIHSEDAIEYTCASLSFVFSTFFFLVRDQIALNTTSSAVVDFFFLFYLPLE